MRDYNKQILDLIDFQMDCLRAEKKHGALFNIYLVAIAFGSLTAFGKSEPVHIPILRLILDILIWPQFLMLIFSMFLKDFDPKKLAIPVVVQLFLMVFREYGAVKELRFMRKHASEKADILQKVRIENPFD